MVEGPRSRRRAARMDHLLLLNLTNEVNNKLLEIHVECYSGYMAEETPRRLLVSRRWVEVVEVLDRWLAPDHRYFKIEGDDGGIYILRHDVAEQCWWLMMFDCRDSRTPTPSRPAGEEL